MAGLAGVPEECAEELAVALENVEFRVEGSAQPVFQVEAALRSGVAESRGEAAGVLGLHVIVIGLNDGFLAGEVVVGGAKGRPGSSGEFAHSGGVEAALTENGQCGRYEMGPSELGLWSGSHSGYGIIEHVQIIAETRPLSSIILNVFSLVGPISCKV